MPRFSTCVVRAGLACFCLFLTARAFGQVGAEESARRIKAADGLEATLWASEPMVINPTNLDIDSRGRVWVAEGLNYRETLHRGQDRIEGSDKIKVLTDTDGDGKADAMTVFADGIFPVPMGIAVEEHYDRSGRYTGCKVYVGNSPNLLVLEDTDGDDKADQRYPLLTGFGGYDHDHGVHGMTFGPDGKLYFTQGDNNTGIPSGLMFDVTDRSGRRVTNDQLATTLRANRDGTQFEIIADRQRNNYETCVNSFGNVFTSDNDDDGNRGSRVIWVMDGGRYGYKTPGSPRHWAEEVPGNVPKLVGTGNGSPCGAMVYEGDLLPGAYHGALLEVDAGTRTVYHFPLTRAGAAFRTEIKFFLTSDDPWFRPVDACVAPDGSVFVPDWYDAGVGGHAFRDSTTGRIYRVQPKGSSPKAPRPDFGSEKGLVEALKSPNIATRDVAFRNLVHWLGQGPGTPLVWDLAQNGRPEFQARALWFLYVQGGAAQRIKDQLADGRFKDARLRELVVRMLGRDCRENGHVEYVNAAAKRPPAALAHRDALLPLAGDPDAGVRRELVLALRNCPTETVGAALTTLARAWDGQDRWYLEALGLALRDRESAFLLKLFDGGLYGDLNLDESGRAAEVALPPYFPVDRNEAFLSVGDALPPASPLSKTLGLMWMVHRGEVLPLLRRILPRLETPELRQAADDVLMQLSDPAGAAALAELVLASDDPVRSRQVLENLARKLEGPWRSAADDPKVIQAIERALEAPSLRAAAIEVIAAAGGQRFVPAVLSTIKDETAAPEARGAAVEALGRLKPPQARETLETLVAAAIERHASDPRAEAAVRTLPRLGGMARVEALLSEVSAPLGLRREALRALVQGNRAGTVLDLAAAGKLPADLKSEAAIALNTIADRRLRDRAAEVLPLPKLAGGKPLPPFYELVRRDGDPAKGRDVFFRVGAARQAAGLQACGACHRVQGEGQWVGPDLSTIGVKYGKDELLRSILAPSSAIGYNLRAYIVATTDGRVVTGLPVEESAERLVLKTAAGERISLRTAEIEDKRYSDVSIMPEGLAEAMGERDIVDLLAFLATLRQPVSIVGRFEAVGPIPAAEARDRISRQGDLKGARRLLANAEGLIDLAPLGGEGVVLLGAPVVCGTAQSARLVIDSRADVQAWLGGKAVALDLQADGTKSAVVALPKGASDLVIQAPAGASLVVTFVADRPIEFVSK